jgi:uncharacterized membrane protein
MNSLPEMTLYVIVIFGLMYVYDWFKNSKERNEKKRQKEIDDLINMKEPPTRTKMTEKEKKRFETKEKIQMFLWKWIYIIVVILLILSYFYYPSSNSIEDSGWFRWSKGW